MRLHSSRMDPPDPGLLIEPMEVHGGIILIDADSTPEGSQLACPEHSGKILFVFGTGWWVTYGGSVVTGPLTGNESSASVEAWCGLCGKYWTVEGFSHAG